MRFERRSRKVIHESEWVNLYIDDVRFPDGYSIERFYLLGFDWPGVAAVPQNDRGDFLLVRVYRYTSQTLRWELPAGRIETGESIIEAAQREVLEETGYLSERFDHIYSYYPMIGIANHVYHIVRCRATEQVGTFDPAEINDVRWFTRTEIEALIAEREIIDGLALTALLMCLR